MRCPRVLRLQHPRRLRLACRFRLTVFLSYLIVQTAHAFYFQRLVALARKMLPSRVRRAVNEEDIALSAFQSFCAGAAAGRFPKVDDPEDLWRLLVVITFRKVRRPVRYRGTKKRGGDLVRGESVFISAHNQSTPSGLAEMLVDGPTPELVASMEIA